MDYLQQILNEVTIITPSLGALIAILIAGILLIFSGFASGSEIAFFSLSPTDLSELDEERNDSDRKIRELREDSERTLATILITNNLVNVTIIMLCNYFFAHVIDFGTAYWLQFIVITVLLTFLLLLFGEIMPKVYAGQKALLFCRKVAGSIMILRKVFFPLSSILIRSGIIAEKVVQKENHVLSVDDLEQALELTDEEELKEMEGTVDDIDFVIESDHLTEFTADLGAYFNLPISKRFALGSKLLIGRSIMQEVNLDAMSSGKCIDVDSKGNPVQSDKDYSTTWDYFTVGGNNTMKFGTGISLTYAYKSNFAWKLFLDYDFARKTYTMTYDPNGYVKDAMPSIYQEIIKEDARALDPETQSIKKNMNNFVLGGSFVVNF